MSLNDSREEKNLANARAESRDRIDAERQMNPWAMMKSRQNVWSAADEAAAEVKRIAERARYSALLDVSDDDEDEDEEDAE